MASPAPWLDIGAARQIAQRHVGQSKELVACWQRPAYLYLVPPVDSLDSGSRDDPFFHFLVVDPQSLRVGGSCYAAVDRRAGEVFEQTIGE